MQNRIYNNFFWTETFPTTNDWFVHLKLKNRMHFKAYNMFKTSFSICRYVGQACNYVHVLAYIDVIISLPSNLKILLQFNLIQIELVFESKLYYEKNSFFFHQLQQYCNTDVYIHVGYIYIYTCIYMYMYICTCIYTCT